MDVWCEVRNWGVSRDGSSGLYGQTAGVDILYSFLALLFVFRGQDIHL